MVDKFKIFHVLFHGIKYISNTALSFFKAFPWALKRQLLSVYMGQQVTLNVITANEQKLISSLIWRLFMHARKLFQLKLSWKMLFYIKTKRVAGSLLVVMVKSSNCSVVCIEPTFSVLILVTVVHKSCVYEDSHNEQNM